MSQEAVLLREKRGKTAPKRRGLSERRVSGRSPDGQPLTPELIEEFLAVMAEAGRTEGTLCAYRRCLNRLYEYLPEGKTIHTGTIDAWKQDMAGSGGFIRSSIEIYCTAANMFLDWCGRADLRGITGAREKKGMRPELTRKEFHRLLYAAKQDGSETVYLMVKTFGILGNAVSELPSLTAESLKKGCVDFPHSGTVYIPSGFREELLDYAGRNGCFAGPVFVSRNGLPLDRSNIWRYIRNLSADAQVDENKCTPQCLTNMCRQTKDDIRQKAVRMEEQMYERLLEKEQNAWGWAE